MIDQELQSTKNVYQGYELMSTKNVDAITPSQCKAARALLERWRPAVAAVGADDAVAQVLEAAPFLWEEAFGAARGALAACHFPLTEEEVFQRKTLDRRRLENRQMEFALGHMPAATP